MRTVRCDEGVGTAIGVKDNIKFERVLINLQNINYTAVKVKSKRGVVLIVSIYVPCKVKREEITTDLQEIMKVSESFDEKILGGDWNAHHIDWLSAGAENVQGRAVAKLVSDNAELEIISTPTPTFRGTTTIDFFIATRGILRGGTTAGVGEELPDHTYITLGIDCGDLQRLEKKSMYVYKDTD